MLPLKLIRSNSVLESGNRTLEPVLHVTGYGTLPALLAVTGDLAHPDLVADHLHRLAALRFTPEENIKLSKNRRKNTENKTKYFRLRLSDEVSTERPETDLRLT